MITNGVALVLCVIFLVGLGGLVLYQYSQSYQEHQKGGAKGPMVFGIGLFKTGTTSLGTAFSKLGYRVSPGFIDLGVSEDAFWDVDSTAAFQPHFDDLKQMINEKRLTALADAPWLYLYKELDQWYPGSKFVLTVRDENSLAASDAKMWQDYGRKPRTPQEYIARYRRHVANVKAYFRGRPQDLLVLDVSSPTAWRELGDFLGTKDIPGGPFPKSNRAGNRWAI